jgi:chromosome segregation ATPase
MMDAGLGAKSLKTGITQPEKTPEKLLAEAERRIKKLEAKIAEQQATIRDLRAEARDFAALQAKIVDLKDDVTELKGEIKEVTRANHEYVARFEALRDETARMRSGTKSPKGLAVTLEVAGRKASDAAAA